jgi:hypothetical protein
MSSQDKAEALIGRLQPCDAAKAIETLTSVLDFYDGGLQSPNCPTAAALSALPSYRDHSTPATGRVPLRCHTQHSRATRIELRHIRQSDYRRPRTSQMSRALLQREFPPCPTRPKPRAAQVFNRPVPRFWG